MLSNSSAIEQRSAARTTPDVEPARQRLLSLFDQEWQYELRSSPEFATAVGDHRYNDRLADVSAEFFRSDIVRRQ
jgi:hypothetical protein